MGDLQCPVRVFLVAVQEAAGQAERLRSQRIAAVYAIGAAASAASDAARTLGVGADLVGGAAPAEGGSTPPEAVREALADIADRHRGEAVLLVDAADAFAAVLRPLVPAQGIRSVPDDEVVALEADADGWRRVTLPL